MDTLTKKKEQATPKDFNDALDKTRQINPLYEDRKKWLEEERLEKEKLERKKLEEGNPNRFEELKKKLRLNNNTHEDILYKKNLDITESEVNNAKRYSWYESKNKELNTKLDDKISSWYDDFYGKKSSIDATGRTISPEKPTNILPEPKSLKTPDGYDMESGFDIVAESTSRAVEGSSTLQTALNSYDFNPKLKVDGDIGPKTTSRTKESLMSFGVKDVVEKIEEQESVREEEQEKEEEKAEAEEQEAVREEEEQERNIDGEIV